MSIFSAAAGTGAYFSDSGSSIFVGAAGVDAFPGASENDPSFYMPDTTVSGIGRSVPTSQGPGLLRAYQDGSLGNHERESKMFRSAGPLRAYQDGSLGHGPGPLHAYRDGSLGRGPGPLRAFKDGSLGGCGCTAGMGEYFATNGLGADAAVTADAQSAENLANYHLKLASIAAVTVLSGFALWLWSKKR